MNVKKRKIIQTQWEKAMIFIWYVTERNPVWLYRFIGKRVLVLDNPFCFFEQMHMSHVVVL